MKDCSIERYGPSALLIRFARKIDEETLARSRGILHALEEMSLTGLVDLVPAYGEVLLEFDHPIERDHLALRQRLAAAIDAAEPLPAESSRLHEIPVHYDGPDLESLAGEKKLTPEEVIARHAAPVYDVYQIGFAPGFPYLGPLHPSLHAPRLANPRTKVPPGSIAIGGEHTGIYSIASPGGWRLIGRTEVVLFSEEKSRGRGSEEAFLLRQGDRVKFVPQP